MRKYFTCLLVIGLIMSQVHTVFAMDMSNIQLLSMDTDENLSNAKVTILDVENSKSYYLDTNSEGYIIDKDNVLRDLGNNVILVAAVYDNYVYNICVDTLNSKLCLKKTMN